MIDLHFQLIESWAPRCTFGSCLKQKHMLCMLGYQDRFVEVVKLVCDAALKTLDNMPYRFFQTDISLYLLFSLFLFCVIFGIFI